MWPQWISGACQQEAMRGLHSSRQAILKGDLSSVSSRLPKVGLRVMGKGGQKTANTDPEPLSPKLFSGLRELREVF